MTRLSAESISFAYAGDPPVFEKLSFEPQRGEVTVLLGANGAGKTTLLRALAGQLQPKTGKVRLNGQPMKEMSRREVARELALMPQSELRQTPLSVRDVVRLGRSAHRGWWMPLDSVDEQRVDSAIQSMDLQSIACRAVTTLSGGQWQRTILARSLAQDASVLLLDEPTSGLDLKHQYECLQTIRDLARSQELIAVLSLHDLQQTATFADRVALISHGGVLAFGDCQSVLTAELIQKAYGIEVTVIPHPVNGRPMVIPTGIV
ncbi:iron complex transport system ATP-binding protein [Neorhodopirellula lusitana]|uniref:Iron complex transport system ATP-binding protein n=1 Tax=Neorhodopirellula lusitana TaxID=445327 RepID=A0ABY1PUA5_9BACT|nr:ABC transporter ATP-binding protein [Neorhodopirellula lusitana]SMP48307.1 iron complex transport system ATP-binding protein [Neorhodopirellula lusitana]